MKNTATGRSALDPIDLKILTHLQESGRMSNLHLAEKVALSPTAVLSRVTRLRKQGYILGYEALLSPKLLDASLVVFVEILLDRTSPNLFWAFKAAVHKRGEIQECHMVAGSFDYLLKIRVRDLDSYRKFTSEVLLQLPGVRTTRSYMATEGVKNTAQIKLS